MSNFMSEARVDNLSVVRWVHNGRVPPVDVLKMWKAQNIIGQYTYEISLLAADREARKVA